MEEAACEFGGKIEIDNYSKLPSETKQLIKKCSNFKVIMLQG